VRGRICLDLGAAAGGFTRVLLEGGAARVYAVDAGFGQLRGSLRQDPRVLNLEATNVSKLDTRLVPEPIDVVTIDVSYLALAAAVAQLGGIILADGADLVGLVKPMFELRLPTAPTDQTIVEAAIERAAIGIAAAGWQVLGSMPSPVLGGRGAVEALMHARRSR
jgi:23S rRNA (cytidine1920-2'-O)/16S rRNA (cytidine1409-2'-O)-methyltransferase